MLLNCHPLCRNNRLLPPSVQRTAALHPPKVSFWRPTEHHCEAGEETHKNGGGEQEKNDSIAHCYLGVRTSCSRLDGWELYNGLR